ncbi:hypothetical protein NDA10_004533 [Ustilago hordei]|uniref:uncharacterized protein n=1 Tax=Ustilago hordei TaxID=120017 RepID=UPI001A45368F|nr:uncharacterized protein UHO2_04993 [Ustilago hordei]KAJ1043282.1 hypothetical protein NDA10_004533 [Ustilago hordei]SYW83076.1 uncharacterized protein UHO2_04993 [Ustilago hordei]
MSTTSPQKRRATSSRSSLLEQPMRQTRSMARVSDATDFPEHHHRLSASSSQQPRSASPRKDRASQAAQVDSFDTSTPDVSMAPCMESPKKGRFDDFEFELENSTQQVPTRRRRIAALRQISTSPSADVGLPGSKTSAQPSSSNASNALLASRKENSSSAVPARPQQKEEARAGSGPTKPSVAPPRVSRLHPPTPSLRTSSHEAESGPRARQKPSSSVGTAPTRELIGTGRDSNHRLLFGLSDTAASSKPNPFLISSDTNSLAALGEPRHSPVKRLNVKSEYVIRSPDRPDRKPINLLELKPSPGKAQRGIFRHNSAQDDKQDDDDGWDDSGSNTLDEIKLVKGPAVKKEREVSGKEQEPSSEDFIVRRGSTSSSTRKSSMPRATSTLDVKHTLSSETSDALASLEASLAKLKAKTRSPPSTGASKKKEDSGDSTLRRELGAARPSGMTSGKTQAFNTKTPISNAGESSFSNPSTADQSMDSSAVFKRPSGRVSALAKSRVSSSSDPHSSLSSSLASSKSIMSFGAPRLPGYSDVGARPLKPMFSSSRTLSLELASTSNLSKAEEEAAQAEEEARVAEAKRQAELKTAKRKSMSSVLSSRMPPPMLQRKEPDAPSRSSSGASNSKSSAASSTPAEPSAAESLEAKKVAKAAHRRSLYTYIPTRRDDADTSIGNLSSNLIGTLSEGDTSTNASKPKRFLRGLTVLVDVRDQDGEDASACWVERLKNAGAKVMLRFGERKLTHIVYKSGRPSTLHSYRALDDPKPHVVGISWVVACLEQGKKADEEPYLVEVAKQAIFTNLRRSSMAPKQVPTSATTIRELEQAKKKLLAHAPAVPSPLRRRVSSRTILASRLAAASLLSEPDATTEATSQSTADQCMGNDANNDDYDEAARLAAYRARVRSVLTRPAA